MDSHDCEDLYDDLDASRAPASVDDCQATEPQTLPSAERTLQQKLLELDTKHHKLKKGYKVLMKQNQILKTNISCLYKTAFLHLKNKEEHIAALKAQLAEAKRLTSTGGDGARETADGQNELKGPPYHVAPGLPPSGAPQNRTAVDQPHGIMPPPPPPAVRGDASKESPVQHRTATVDPAPARSPLPPPPQPPPHRMAAGTSACNGGALASGHSSPHRSHKASPVKTSPPGPAGKRDRMPSVDGAATDQREARSAPEQARKHRRCEHASADLPAKGASAPVEEARRCSAGERAPSSESASIVRPEERHAAPAATNQSRAGAGGEQQHRTEAHRAEPGPAAPSGAPEAQRSREHGGSNRSRGQPTGALPRTADGDARGTKRLREHSIQHAAQKVDRRRPRTAEAEQAQRTVRRRTDSRQEQGREEGVHARSSPRKRDLRDIAASKRSPVPSHREVGAAARRPTLPRSDSLHRENRDPQPQAQPCSLHARNATDKHDTPGRERPRATAEGLRDAAQAPNGHARVHRHDSACSHDDARGSSEGRAPPASPRERGQRPACAHGSRPPRRCGSRAASPRTEPCADLRGGSRSLRGPQPHRSLQGREVDLRDEVRNARAARQEQHAARSEPAKSRPQSSPCAASARRIGNGSAEKSCQKPACASSGAHERDKAASARCRGEGKGVAGCQGRARAIRGCADASTGRQHAANRDENESCMRQRGVCTEGADHKQVANDSDQPRTIKVAESRQEEVEDGEISA